MEEKRATPSSRPTTTTTTTTTNSLLLIVGFTSVALGLGLGLGLGLRASSSNNSESKQASSSCSNGDPYLATTHWLQKSQWIDLTYAHNTDTLYWPTSPTAFEWEVLFDGDTESGYYYSANQFCTPEHGGTHIDAPVHFARDGHTTDEIPLEHLHGPGIVLNVSEKATENPDYLLTLQDVFDFEEVYGEIPRGSVFLLRTGWGKHYGDRLAYFGDDTPGDASNLHFPSFGVEAVQFLIDERNITMLGVDTPSIDHGPSTEFLVHRLAFAANVPGLENVANLDQLPATNTWIIALPMKLDGGSGGPARIVALIPPPLE